MNTNAVAVDALLKRLSSRFGDWLRTDDEALAKASGDESGLAPQQPAGVIFPVNAADVAAVASEASSRGVPLVARGGGTGKAGACIPAPGSIVLDFTKMNRVLEMRPQDLYAVVQPGLITGDLHAAAAEVGYLYPPDPASFESCTIGGNISTNSGGMRAVKYGVTKRYIRGLEIVTPTGAVHRIGRRSIKGVAGLDLTLLVVGSEGTLAFVTEAIVHIIPAPEAVETAWLTFPDPIVASRAAEKIFAAGFVPRIMELMDDQALAVIRSKAEVAIPDKAATCMLLEMDGPNERAFDDLTRVCEIAVDAGATESALARKEKDREAMRRARRLVASSLKETYGNKISDDVAVPRSRMPEMLVGARAEADAARVLFCAYGHLGDGNVHVNLLCKSREEHDAADPLRRRLLTLAVSLGGTVSGEHGIGLAKRDMLGIEQSDELMALQRQVKQVFDPNRIMNPGKIWP